MIDQKLKAWVLEINHSPSLNIYFKKDELKIPGMHGKDQPPPEDPVIDKVDLYVKSKVVEDTLNLI
jgi:hypothetical protein